MSSDEQPFVPIPAAILANLRPEEIEQLRELYRAAKMRAEGQCSPDQRAFRPIWN